MIDNRLRAIFELLQSPEYVVLQEHIEDVKKVIIRELLKQKSLEEIRDLQARYQAFDSILTSIEYFANEYQEQVKEKELSDLEEKYAPHRGV